MRNSIGNEIMLERPETRLLLSQAFLKDLLLTLAAALWTGLAASTLFVLLVFLTHGEAQAAEDASGMGNLALYAMDGRQLADAPLLFTDYRIEIHGNLAQVKLEQHFINSGEDWLEGIYQFPLLADSAVEQLRMRVGERLLEGEIQERSQAKASYAKAKVEGRRASLVSQQRPNIFTTSVANIGPGETIRIEIGYQQILHYDQGWFQLRLPLVIGPRYIPGNALAAGETHRPGGTGWSLDTDQVPDASHITPPVVDPREGAVNPVSLSIRLDPGMELEQIHSGYHEMETRVDAQGVYHLSLESRILPADRDFELRWKPLLEQSPRPVIFSETWEGEEYALLMLFPPIVEQETRGQPREILFVVDTSGSMHGASLEQARAALQLAISRLDEQDRFNLIQFNNRTHALFDHLVPANRQNLNLALAYVSGLRAEGGTEMLPAMQRALQHHRETGRLRQVVFLTDGSVGNEQALFELIRQRLGDSRLFTIGIGSAPNSYFMQRAAEFGRGSFTYIGDLAEVETRMRGLFEKLEHPALVDIRMMWNDGPAVESFPTKVPDLYLGEPLVLVLRSEALPEHLTLAGQLDGMPWQETTMLQRADQQTGIHRLWARAKIKQSMAELSRGGDPEKLGADVLKLALQHRLVSRYTSLVVVDKTVARDRASPLKQGLVPTNLPHGWSASKVFGTLPQTATASRLHLLIGLILVLSGLLLSAYARCRVR